MIKQAKIIKEFCEREGFDFVDYDKENRRVPCSLDKGYVENNHTIFIKGFVKGSKRIQVSRGGLKSISNLNTPIDCINEKKWVEENCLPLQFICDKCGKKNLNLRTQDNHKTYDCPGCQKNKKLKKENKNE